MSIVKVNHVDLSMPGLREIIASKYDCEILSFRDEMEMRSVIRFYNSHGRSVDTYINDDEAAMVGGYEALNLPDVIPKIRIFMRPAYRHFDWDYKPEWKKRRDFLFKKFKL